MKQSRPLKDLDVLSEIETLPQQIAREAQGASTDNLTNSAQKITAESLKSSSQGDAGLPACMQIDRFCAWVCQTLHNFSIQQHLSYRWPQQKKQKDQ
jgi:hypothetical protein